MKPVPPLLTVCVCLTAAAARGGDPVTLPDEEDVAEVEEGWDFTKGRGVDPVVMERLNIMVPVGGRPHEGLSYRVYGDRTPETGTPLTALFESNRVTRMDETHLLFEGAVYSSFDDSKRPATVTRTVTFKDAIYNLHDRLLFSNEPLTIEDQNMRIHCGGILYDLATGLTLYTGGVEIYFDEAAVKPGEAPKPNAPVPVPAPAQGPKAPLPSGTDPAPVKEGNKLPPPKTTAARAKSLPFLNPMKISAFLVLFSAAALAVRGQEKKPADPKAKPAVHSPEQSALNTAKQDARNPEALKKAKAALDRALHKNDAVKKEVERMEKPRGTPTTEEAKAKLEKLKNSLDPKDREELEKMMKESKEAVQDKVKEAVEGIRERNRKEGAVAPVPPAEKDDTPGSFDNPASREPLPVRREPVFTPAPLFANVIIPGITHDPKDPAKELPKSDPRTRTFVLDGEARLRLPDKSLDADEVYVVFKEGRAPGGNSVKGKKKPTAAADPVKGPGVRDSAIERIIARGRVRFMFVDKDGQVQAGRCGNMIYEDAKGWFILKDWPEIEIGGRLVRGPTRESVMRLSQKNPEDTKWEKCDIWPLDRELLPSDVPRDRKTDVPPARPIRSGPVTNSSEIR